MFRCRAKHPPGAVGCDSLRCQYPKRHLRPLCRILRLTARAEVLFSRGHQFAGAYPECGSDFQYQRQRRHMLPAFDLAHVRTRYSRLIRKIVLSDPCATRAARTARPKANAGSDSYVGVPGGRPG